MEAKPSRNPGWKSIYPVYINSNKTISEGRRIAAAKAVPNPTAAEIAEVLKFLGYEFRVEPDKAYSRDWTLKGRVAVRIRTDAGQPVNEKFKTKRELLVHIASLIPNLQSRHTSGTQSQQQGSGGKQGKKKGK